MAGNFRGETQTTSLLAESSWAEPNGVWRVVTREGVHGVMSVGWTLRVQRWIPQSIR